MTASVQTADVKVCRTCMVPIDPTPRQKKRGDYLCQRHKAEYESRRNKRDLSVCMRKYQDAWARNPSSQRKIAAQKLAQMAKKNGLLVKPECCESCLRPAGRLEMHHENYNLPLAVVFLCKSCHGIADHRMRMRQRGEGQ